MWQWCCVVFVATMIGGFFSSVVFAVRWQSFGFAAVWCDVCTVGASFLQPVCLESHLASVVFPWPLTHGSGYALA